MKIYIDGRYCDERNAKVSVFDHGLLYGDGIFEGIRAYNGRVFRLKEHIRRLHDSCRIYRIELSFDQLQLERACCALVSKNELEDCYLRPMVLRGYGAAGLNPTEASDAGQ